MSTAPLTRVRLTGKSKIVTLCLPVRKGARELLRRFQLAGAAGTGFATPHATTLIFAFAAPYSGVLVII